MERNIILVDVDHVIANSFWRDPMMDGKDWDAYHAASKDDKSIEDIVGIINSLSHSYNVIAITARPEKWRKLTMESFLKWKVSIHELLMRPDNEFRPSPEIKMELVSERFGPDWAQCVAFILEDRDDVTAAFKAAGVTVLQVHGRRT